MKKSLLTLSLLFVAVIALASDWHTDILGDGYKSRYVEQPDDYSGKVRSTIIRKSAPCRRDRGMLYIHGYNDYFFQREMGDRFVDSCISFYAVDLRKYGRSILPGQKKFQARDLHEYFADIDSALAQMHADGVNNIVLIGHSTGGLIASLYMHEHPKSDINGLILNSPFLAWNLGGFKRKVAVPVVSAMAKLFPNMAISQGDNTGYAESLLKSHHGEWDYNTDWKLFHSQKVQSSWIRAITRAQNELKHNADIDVPVLLMHSSGSVGGSKWTPEYQHNDAVLNVNDISRIGRTLGPDVTEDIVPGGLHDLVLSSSAVRSRVYDDMFRWLRNKDIFR